MATNTQLTLAPSLQMYFVDKDTGLPLVGGKVYFYKAGTQVAKAVYEQTGSAPPYNYTALTQPVILSSVGTFQDADGNDILPYYYPFDGTPDAPSTTPQLYDIAVYDANDVLQFTREGFPKFSTSSGGVTGDALIRNYIVNNVFWRPAPYTSDNTTADNNVLLAPGAHDGFTNGDIRYIKNIQGATETLTFPAVTPQFNTLPDVTEATPEVAFRLNCTGSQVGETLKALQFPISLHVSTLSNQIATLTFWAKGSASANNTIQPYIYQFAGTGASSQPAPIAQGPEINLTTAWTKYTVPLLFPDASAVTVSAVGDDALYLQLGLPLALTCDVFITKPCIYLGENDFDVTNQFDTYDEIDSIVNTPRTGDIRESMNSFAPHGWVAMNDGTIGNASSNGSARKHIDTWQLFSLLWTNTAVTSCQLYTSAGVVVAKGASAFIDFTANTAISIPKSLGRVLGATNVTPTSIVNKPFTASDDGGHLLITVDDNSSFYKGTLVQFSGASLPTNLSAATNYYATPKSGSTIAFYVSTTIANVALDTYVAFGGAGTAPYSVFTINIAKTLGEYLGGELDYVFQQNLPNELIGTRISNISLNSTGAGSGLDALDNTASFADANITNIGTNVAINNIQPTTYMNRFIKL